MADSWVGNDRLGIEGDDFYELLMHAHGGLTPEESHVLNARLVLLLANQIADREKLEALINLAKKA